LHGAFEHFLSFLDASSTISKPHSVDCCILDNGEGLPNEEAIDCSVTKNQAQDAKGVSPLNAAPNSYLPIATFAFANPHFPHSIYRAPALMIANIQKREQPHLHIPNSQTRKTSLNLSPLYVQPNVARCGGGF
jgi:hypothetical protein